MTPGRADKSPVSTVSEPAVATATPTERMNGTGAARAAMAILIGWYVLSVLIVLAGLAVTVVALLGSGKFTVADALPAIVSVLVLLTLRRPVPRFVAPGPRLIRGEQPELFPD